MAQSKSALKRVRQNEAAKARNRWRKRTMREAIKAFRDALTSGSPEQAQEALRNAGSVIDRTAQKGVIHRNQASRRKSRLAKVLAARQAKA